MALTKEAKQQLVTDFGRKEGDTGSPEVQVAILTKRIVYLTEHLRANKGDESSRRGLLKLVGARRRHLMYLAKRNPKAYEQVVAKLGLRRK
jgi:small subunit ribosomal protein S15